MKAILTLLGLLSLAAGAAQADTLRCHNGMVAIGDSKVAVHERCGEPFYQEVISGEDQAKVEQWYYKPGPGEFMRILTFRSGRLESIELDTRSRQ